MLRVTSAVFSDQIHELSDGRNMLGPVWPGLVRYDGRPGDNLLACLLLMIRWPDAGPREVEIHITGPDGATAHRNTISMTVADARADVQVAARNIAVRMTKAGPVTVTLREVGLDWVEAAVLNVDMAEQAKPPLTARFGYGTGDHAKG